MHMEGYPLSSSGLHFFAGEAEVLTSVERCTSGPRGLKRLDGTLWQSWGWKNNPFVDENTSMKRWEWFFFFNRTIFCTVLEVFANTFLNAGTI